MASDWHEYVSIESKRILNSRHWQDKTQQQSAKYTKTRKQNWLNQLYRNWNKIKLKLKQKCFKKKIDFIQYLNESLTI